MAVLKSGIAEVGIEMLQLLGQHQALINDGTTAQAGDVETLHPCGPGLVSNALAGHKEQPLEGFTRLARFRRATQDHLAQPRSAGLGPVAQGRVDHGHRAEGQHFQMQPFQHLADDLPGFLPIFGILAIEEKLAHGQIRRVGGGKARQIQLSVKEFVGQLGEDTGPVAGFAIIGHGPAVGMVAEGFQGHLQDLVAAPPLHMGHKADAAGVMLEAGIVQPLLGRQPGHGVHGDLGKVRAG